MCLAQEMYRSLQIVDAQPIFGEQVNEGNSRIPTYHVSATSEKSPERTGNVGDSIS